jgi:oligopeptide/dipeptide ABC transporter ATP-binding protein
MNLKEKVIEVNNLKVYFNTEEGIAKAVDGVSFDVKAGETLGVVGESGCGKSVTSLGIMRLIDTPPGEIVDGQVFFGGQDILKISDENMRNIRGNGITMIFQEPMTSLNPVYPVGYQIAEAILSHKKMNKKDLKALILNSLKNVGISSPEKFINMFPHQLSGGLRQRIMIAMALSCNPQLLIADEPTTALDVSIQAQILDLLNKLKKDFNMSIIFITHDLGVIAEMSDKVLVMYAGKVVEYTDVVSLFKKTKHPYTLGLLESIPKLTQKENVELYSIPGLVPSAIHLPQGCKYNNRCPLSDNKCQEEEPELEEVEKGHFVRCWHFDQTKKILKTSSTQM